MLVVVVVDGRSYLLFGCGLLLCWVFFVFVVCLLWLSLLVLVVGLSVDAVVCRVIVG